MKRLFKNLSKRLTLVILAILILGLPLLYLTILNSPTAKASWFDDNWAYRQNVALTNSGTAQADFQVLITLDTGTLISAGKMQSSCNDIRVTDITGQLLPYWIETGTNACNTSTTAIWTKVPSIGTTGNTLYVYYGNPSAVNAQNGNQVFEYFDDFSTNTASNYTVTSGSISVSGGNMNITGVNTNNAVIAPTVQKTLSSYVVEARASLTGAINGAADYLVGVLGFQSSVGSSNTGYVDQFGSISSAQKIDVEKFTLSHNANTGVSFSDGTSYLVKGSFTPGTITSTFQRTTSTTFSDSTYTSGPYGLRTYNSNATIDFWFVRKFASTEPSVASPASEETSPGPIAYWKFDDGTGTTAKDSTNSGRNGTLSGSTLPTWQTEDQCIFGKCLYFDGSSSNIGVGATASVNIKTVSMWVKPTSVSSSALIDLDGGTHKITVSSGTISATGFSSPTIYVNGAVSSTLAANTWQQVEVTTATSFNANNGLMTIAKSSSTYLNGFMDEVKLYNYVRSATQVNTDYNSRGSVKGAATNLGNIATNVGVGNSAPIAYYNFEEQTGTTVNDRSGSGNTGTWAGTGNHWTVGKYGGAGNFNGTDDSISATVTSPLNQTVSYWAKDTTDNLWHFYALVNGTPYKDGVQTDYANKHFYRSGNTIYIGQYDTAPNDSTLTSNLKLWLKADTLQNSLSNGSAVSSWTDYSSAVQTVAQSTPASRPTFYTGGSNNQPYIRSDAGSPNLTLTQNTSLNHSGEYTLFVVARIVTHADYMHFLIKGSASPYPTQFQLSVRPNGYLYSYGGLTGGGGTPIVGSIDPSGAWAIIEVRQILSGGNTNATFTVNGTDYVGDGPVTGTTPNVTDNGSVCSSSGGVLDCSEFVLYTSLLSAANRQKIETYLQDKYNISGATPSRNYFTGQIDDFKVYNYARTAAQIVADMNAGHPAPGSPVGSAIGYWKFDEGYGTTANNSGNQGSTLNGTLNNMSSPATSTSGWTQSGEFSKALNFDGSNDYVEMPSSVAFDSTTATWTGWFKSSQSVASNHIWITGRGDASGTLNGIYITMQQTTGYLTAGIKNGSSTMLDISGTTAVNDGNWHHYAFVFNGAGTAYLYLDGKLAASGTPTATGTFNSQVVRLGKSLDSFWGLFNGSMDEIKVYNFALTASQVLTDMNRQSGQVLGALSDNSSYQPQAANQEYCIPGDTTSCSAPVGRWDFEEGVGTSVNDTSSGGNIGSWNGTGVKHWVPGKVGMGGNFNGSDDFVSVAATIAGIKSVSFWVYPTTTTQSLIDLNGSAYITVSSGTISTTGFTSPTKYINGVVNGTLTANQWNHVEVTTATAISASAITLGKANSLFLNGKLDQVRLYDYARSNAQVYWDYNRGAPITWWKFDECQGTVLYDSAVNSNGTSMADNATINIVSAGSQASVGTCSTSSTAWGNGATGKYNSALKLDGTDDYVLIPSWSTIKQSTMSVSAWLNLPTTDNANYRPLGGQQFCGATQFDFTARNNAITFNVPNAAGTCGEGSASTSYTAGTWMHVVGTFDGTNTRIYINGTLKATDTSFSGSFNTSPTEPFVMGRADCSVGCRYLNYTIDDVKIFGYTLTATQIQQLYNQGSSVRYGPVTGSP